MITRFAETLCRTIAIVAIAGAIILTIWSILQGPFDRGFYLGPVTASLIALFGAAVWPD